MSTYNTSKAHEKSAPFIIDPAYYCTPELMTPIKLAADMTRECNKEGVWLYGESQLECYRLAILRKRAQDAKLKVYYPGTFTRPCGRGMFRLKSSSLMVQPMSMNFSFRANGRVVVTCRDTIIYKSNPCTEIQTFSLEEGGPFVIEISTSASSSSVDTTDPNEPPCLWITANSSPQSVSQVWEWSSNGNEWAHTRSFPPIKGFAYPHLVEPPEMRLVPKTQLDDDIYDFGCELLGSVVVSCENEKNEETPIIRVGESLVEAMNDNPAHFEQSTEMVAINETWQSLHLLAFRYVRVVGGSGIKEVVCNAIFHPTHYRGAFAASDDCLTRIWMNSAYTLRLCMHDFLLDGIKRDRLPWAGDLAVSLLANAYTFADAEIVRRSLTVLGRAGIAETDINGIVDYSLWWVICQDMFQLYFDDRQHLEREWKRIKATLQCLIERSDEDGFLKLEDNDWVFIDWAEGEDKTTALQILLWWALDCGLRLAQSMSDENITKILQGQQSKLKASLLSCCWDAAAGIWKSAPGESSTYSRHANILAVVSGLTTDGTIVETDLVAVGTPYMKTFECLALAALAAKQEGVGALRTYWARMTENGATTYWEACRESDTEETIPEFYGRPYGRSLCHAWSSGPSFMLPELILGVRPLSAGWETWTCDPQLGELEWVSSTVPTPYGCIEIEATSEFITISVPKGTTLCLLNGTSYPGPDFLVRPTKETAMDTIDTKTVKEWSAPYRGWAYYPTHVIPPKPNVLGFEDVYMTDVPTVYQLPDVDDKWFMSFIGFNGKGYQSFVAESTDLLNWGNMQLAMGFGGEREFDFGGCVIGAFLYEDYGIKARRTLQKKDGKYWSLYGAYSKQGKYEIDPGYEGLASSDDGLTWRRAKAQYILSVHDDHVQDWERDSIYQPWLVEHEGKYYNFYNAKRMPEWVEQIGLATSTDLFDWKRHKGNPVVRVRPDSYDSDFVADGKVFRDGNHWTMFYFGVGKGGAHIMVAFSRDLVRWTSDPEPLYKAGGNPSGLDCQYAHKISLVWNPGTETWYMYYDAVGNDGRGIGLITSRILCKDITSDTCYGL